MILSILDLSVLPLQFLPNTQFSSTLFGFYFCSVCLVNSNNREKQTSNLEIVTALVDDCQPELLATKAVDPSEASV